MHATQRKFLVNLAFLIFVNLLVKPFWIFGIDRTVQNVVGTEDYGIYFAVLNLSYLFNMVLDFGINNFNSRSIARNESLLDKFLPNMFVIKGTLSLAYILITLSMALVIDFSTFHMKILGLLIINQILVTFIFYFRSNIAALHLFKTDAFFSVLDKLLMIMIIGFLISTEAKRVEFTIQWFVLGQTASYVITFILAFIYVLGKTSRLKLKWEPKLYKKIILMSYPFALLGVLMSIYNRIDGVMIERLLGPAGAREAGIYAASYRVLDAVNMIGFAFATILLPMFARLIKQKVSIGNLLGLSFKTIYFGAAIVATASWFYRVEIMELLYVEQTAYWSELFGYLMISFVGVATVYIFGSLLTANGSLKYLNYIAITGVLMNITLNLILIPRYQALGATIATLVTQMLVAIAHVLASIKVFNFKTNVSILTRLLLFTLITVGVFYVINLIIDNWAIAIIASVILCTLSAFLLKVMDFNTLRSELRR